MNSTIILYILGILNTNQLDLYINLQDGHLIGNALNNRINFNKKIKKKKINNA